MEESGNSGNQHFFFHLDGPNAHPHADGRPVEAGVQRRPTSLALLWCANHAPSPELASSERGRLTCSWMLQPHVCCQHISSGKAAWPDMQLSTSGAWAVTTSAQTLPQQQLLLVCLVLFTQAAKNNPQDTCAPQHRSTGHPGLWSTWVHTEWT